MSTSPDALDGIIAALETAGRLKRLKRAGWLRVGIPDGESVADHSYRLALLALVLGPRLGLDVDRMVRLALLHDLGEARLGDLTPADGVSPADKHEREAVAFGEVIEGLPEGAELLAAWDEYEASATPESQIVHQLDKLELALQALEYERAYGQDLSEFWQSARTGISEPVLVELFERMRAGRPRK